MEELEKEFVPYDIALAMKELGFDEPCLDFYWHDTKHWRKGTLVTKNVAEHTKEACIKAPLYQQSFRWLREKHNIHGLIEVDWKKGEGVTGYIVTIVTKDIYSDMDLNIFKTYEETERLLLEKLIDIVKEKVKIEKR